MSSQKAKQSVRVANKASELKDKASQEKKAAKEVSKEKKTKEVSKEKKAKEDSQAKKDKKEKKKDKEQDKESMLFSLHFCLFLFS
jgi:hypothetical protein